MSEQMARHKANDNHPANFPEDTGFRLCNECGEHIKVDLTNAKEAEVEEYDSCYQHLSTVEELREECFNKGRSIDRLVKELKEKDTKAVSLNEENTELRRKIWELGKDNAFLKRGWEIKDARILELESQVRYRDGHIEELQEQLKAV